MSDQEANDTVEIGYDELKGLFSEYEFDTLKRGIALRLSDLKEMMPDVNSYERGIIKGQLEAMDYLLSFLIVVSRERYKRDCKVLVNKAIAKLN